MTPSQLRQWSFQNSQPDQWWLSLDGVTEEVPYTSAEIEERLNCGGYSTAQALHVSQGDIENPTWVEVTMPTVMKNLPAMLPLVDATMATTRTANTAKKKSTFNPVPSIYCVIVATVLLLFLSLKFNSGFYAFFYGLIVATLAFVAFLIIYFIWRDSKKLSQEVAPAPLPASHPTATAETQKPQEATIQHLLIGMGAIALGVFIMGKMMTCGESSGGGRKQSQAQAKPPAVESSTSSEWYVGGTLSSGRATMADWKRASYKDRLASSADFVARSIGGELGDLDMDDDIKPAAVRLELEISAAYEPGVTDNFLVTEIAAALVIVLKDRGQWLR